MILGGGTPILGHKRGAQPEWVIVLGQTPVNGCQFLYENLRMGHIFDTKHLWFGLYFSDYLQIAFTG